MIKRMRLSRREQRNKTGGHEKTLRPAGSVHASNRAEPGSWRVGGADVVRTAFFGSKGLFRVAEVARRD